MVISGDGAEWKDDESNGVLKEKNQEAKEIKFGEAKKENCNITILWLLNKILEETETRWWVDTILEDKTMELME